MYLEYSDDVESLTVGLWSRDDNLIFSSRATVVAKSPSPSQLGELTDQSLVSNKFLSAQNSNASPEN